MGLKEQCLMQIDKATENVLYPDAIRKYLDIVANCSNMSYINHLLIYAQYPDATDVAGVQAWKTRGRTIAKETKPIVLLYPKVWIKDEGVPYEDENGNALCEAETETPLYTEDPSFAFEYITVCAFDIKQTIGSTPSAARKTGNFIEQIIQLTGYVIMQVPAQDLPEQRENGYCSIAEREFQIKENLTDEERDRTLLSLYIHYVFGEELETDQDIDYNYSRAEEQLTRYCILKYFDLQEKQPSFLFVNKLSTAPLEIKKKILYKVSYMSNKIINEMSGYTLSFDETALINNILVSPSYQEFAVVTNNIVKDIDDETMWKTITSLSRRIMKTRSNFLECLYDESQRQSLYTYPAREVDMDSDAPL